MALRDLGRASCRALWRDGRPGVGAPINPLARRNIRTRAGAKPRDLNDLESSSFLTPIRHPVPEEKVSTFDPLARSENSKRPLPSSRYQYRSPKYYRGPLHPHQPPRPSDPASREFYAGPFSLPRLQQTYESTIASDILALQYTHYPPGYKAPPRGPRLREWVGDNPYFKGRPPRPPRGSDVLRPLDRPTTFRNIPKVTGVIVHTQASAASKQNDSAYLHVAGMAIQAITGARVEVHKARRSVMQWGLRAGRNIAVTAELKGETMYHFLSKTIEMVMPRIKDYPGVPGTSGDDVGNITFGFKPAELSLYPEIEVNYDAYPPKMIPGCHITVQTSATNDYEARLLLMSMGMPFYGKVQD
ncbi:50S ribosomal subunit L7 [Aulographum hederae CBS 113979]|uniref:50S ribosomal subunit L7 n=1 Tax=Aulographum hederae CBS 113979 TaxID=1176131 RepID=A0A6G1GR52_9PEZI|nr:50S ribosomal subunit L7 [Aulographum hederae CBS 113979]